MWKRRGAIAGLLLLATGCGGEQIDEDAWRTALADQGVEPSDWETYRDVWTRECDASDNELQLFVAQVLDAKTATADVIKTNLNNACPDRLGDVTLD